MIIFSFFNVGWILIHMYRCMEHFWKKPIVQMFSVHAIKLAKWYSTKHFLMLSVLTISSLLLWMFASLIVSVFSLFEILTSFLFKTHFKTIFKHWTKNINFAFLVSMTLDYICIVSINDDIFFWSVKHCLVEKGASCAGISGYFIRIAVILKM